MGEPARLADAPTAEGGPIDWDTARATARRLVRPGPAMPRSEAAATVQRLREHAVTAEDHVRDLTGLDDGSSPRPADVVDRPGWIDAAAGGLQVMLSGLPTPGRNPVGRFTAQTAGVQAGAALAFLGSRVLGQYDPFGGPAESPGRLLLVAPNVVTVQRALHVPAEEFEMWVCLHESTHRLQFNAVPWLREHFASEVATFLSVAENPEALTGMLGRLPEALRTARRDGVRDSVGLLALLQTPEQRAVMDRLLALATLLEGHADHVMDAVGPAVVPSVETIRRKFTARRQGGGLGDRIVRAVLGLDAKLRQYAEGAAFTRHVVGTAGMDGFNAVWTSPETLPSRAEITAPEAWLRRVHG
ncbi:MAG: coenzyme F420 biosynthesis-associated protein [Pseudonocardiaceae bacterium]|nr:coenzyme F420 biosynthesis-associated protein [Pseudonocardiaceae bacterium]